MMRFPSDGARLERAWPDRGANLVKTSRRPGEISPRSAVRAWTLHGDYGAHLITASLVPNRPPTATAASRRPWHTIAKGTQIRARTMLAISTHRVKSHPISLVKAPTNGRWSRNLLPNIQGPSIWLRPCYDPRTD